VYPTPISVVDTRSEDEMESGMYRIDDWQALTVTPRAGALTPADEGTKPQQNLDGRRGRRKRRARRYTRPL
jgi:hypothetical protein